MGGVSGRGIHWHRCHCELGFGRSHRENLTDHVLTQFASTFFPILAPLPVERTASALAFFAFLRAFAQTWGIAISSTILQNELKRRLPPDFVALFPDGVEIAYAAIPTIKTLQEPLRGEVGAAFAGSMSIIWKTMIGISGLGLLTVTLLREVPMKEITDERYGLHDAEKDTTPDIESGNVTPLDEKVAHGVVSVDEVKG